MKLPKFPFRIANQILNAGTSIGANIEESRAPASRRDLTAKFVVALKEARETKFWLRLIRATNLAPAELTEHLYRESDELVAILTVSVRNLRG
jgi:four helix bundle protein